MQRLSVRLFRPRIMISLVIAGISNVISGNEGFAFVIGGLGGCVSFNAASLGGAGRVKTTVGVLIADLIGVGLAGSASGVDRGVGIASAADTASSF